MIATRLGEGLKYDTSINEINGIATAIFNFPVKEFPNDNITASRSKLIYNWVMTLSEIPYPLEQKQLLLKQFIENLTPQNSPLRKLMTTEEIEYSFDLWSLIHKDIQKVAQKKFDDGHFSDAVESAFKEVNVKVKQIVLKKTGVEKDGASLMTHAFSVNNPTIPLDDLNTMTGKDTQLGYMQIFAGSMTGIRNPKAHNNFLTTKEKAIHFLFLASLLMLKIDDSKSFITTSQ